MAFNKSKNMHSWLVKSNLMGTVLLNITCLSGDEKYSLLDDLCSLVWRWDLHQAILVSGITLLLVFAFSWELVIVKK